MQTDMCRPDVEAASEGQGEGCQALCHACHSIRAVGIVPTEGLQHHMGPGKWNAEVLRVQHHKVPKELLHLQQPWRPEPPWCASFTIWQVIRAAMSVQKCCFVSG